MMWKAIFVMALAGGVLGEFHHQLKDELQNLLQFPIAVMCKKSNAEERAPEVLAAVLKSSDCLTDNFDVEAIQKDMSAVIMPRDNGFAAFKILLNKYCVKSSELKSCIDTLVAGLMPCMPTEARKPLATAANFTEHFIDLVCDKDGEMIASFLTQNGTACLEEKADALQTCYENTRKSVGSYEDAMALSNKAKCEKLDEVTTCVVTAVQDCKNQAALNLFKALFKFIKDESPCDDDDDNC